MGSLHERRLYEDGEHGAYQFSFGHFETGLWVGTIMSYGDEPEYLTKSRHKAMQIQALWSAASRR